MEDYYNVIAGSYNELHGEEQEEKLRLLKVHWNPRGLILDIGCGTNIANKFFKNIIGIDKNFKMLKTGINVCCLAEHLPFKDKSFDAILCLTAFHNFDNPERAISEMKRVVKKDNVVISILKKSKKFNKLKGIIEKNFNAKKIDSKKDVIFISQTC